MFQATRRRLAFWYTTVTAIVLLLFATAVYLYVSNTLVERIDDTLKHVIEVVDRSLVIENVSLSEGKYRVNVEASFRNNTRAVEDDHIDLEWFSPTGELLWTTFSETPNIPLSLHKSGQTVHIEADQLLRQVTRRIEFGRYVLGYLRVSHPWFEFTKPLRQLIWDLAIGISMMVFSVGAIGWLLSGIAIKPVKDSYQSLKQFTADASHELRNPIAMIQTNVQMALNYADGEPQLQETQLRVIERLTRRLGRLVNDLLFLARSDSGTLQLNNQPVPLDALLLEVIEEQRLIAEQKGINLLFNPVEPDGEIAVANEEDLFTLQGDWDHLASLFTNLISNAIEHSFSESTASKDTRQVKIELQLIKRERQPQLQVKVEDNGIGMPATELAHIFDRFYRLDASRSQQRKPESTTGSGLGLAIVKVIVANYQGQINVTSTPNQGTIFTVTLPKTLT